MCFGTNVRKEIDMFGINKKGPNALHGGLTAGKTLMRSFAVLVTAAVATGGLVATAGPASAWSTSNETAGSICTDQGTVDVTGSIKNNEPLNAPANYDMQIRMVRILPNGADGEATAFKLVPKQQTGSFVINTTLSSIDAGKVRFDLKWKDGSSYDKRFAYFPKVHGCKGKVTPTPPTSTPEDCFKGGSASVSAQQGGIIVKVNNVVVTTPWTTSTPGTYKIEYFAADNKVLTNNPSTTLVVKDKLPLAECTQPAHSGTVSCAGYVLVWSNLEGKQPYSVPVTKPDGTKETVIVPAGGTATRTYPVIEDATSSVKAETPGLEPLVLTFAADCVPVVTPPPVPPTPPTPPVVIPPEITTTEDVLALRTAIKGNCLTPNWSEFRTVVKNFGRSTTSKVTGKVVVNGKVVDRLTKLRPGQKWVVTDVVPTGSRVKLFVNGELSRKLTTPINCGGGHVTPGGLRTSKVAAG